MAPQLPLKKTLPLAPFVVVFALVFWVFWRLLAPSEVTQVEVTEDTLNLAREESNSASSSVEPSVLSSALPSASEISPVNAINSSAPSGAEASIGASLPPSGDGSKAVSSNTPSVKAFALARQAALLLPMDAPRAIVLAQESVTLYPNREAYRVLISYADRKDRAIQKETYLKACLALTSDTKGVDYCYVDKTPEVEASDAEPDLFAPIPEPSLDAARQVTPPTLDSTL